MGLLIIGLLVIVLGVILYNYDCFYGSESWGIGLIVLGSIFMAILLIILAFRPIYESQLIVEYEEDKMYLESIFESKHITGDEREKAIDLIMSDNKIIRVNRIRQNSFWIGIYYADKVGELECFNVSMVPEVFNRQSIEISN